MNRKKELKNEYLRRQLGDPGLPVWRRASIRARLGIPAWLTAADLRRPLDEHVLRVVTSYVEEQARRLDPRGGFEAFPEGIRALYHLAGFSATFESDGFTDYSDDALAQDASLRSEREGRLAALRYVGLDADAERLETVWHMPGPGAAEMLEALQKRYWGEAFRSEWLGRTGRLLHEVEGELLSLQER